jgi:hypothetical protein
VSNEGVFSEDFNSFSCPISFQSVSDYATAYPPTSIIPTSVLQSPLDHARYLILLLVLYMSSPLYVLLYYYRQRCWWSALSFILGGPLRHSFARVGGYLSCYLTPSKCLKATVLFRSGPAVVSISFSSVYYIAFGLGNLCQLKDNTCRRVHAILE